MYERSIEDPAGFWSEIASQFYWKEKWDLEVYSENIDVRKGTIRFEVSFLTFKLLWLKIMSGGKMLSWFGIVADHSGSKGPVQT